MKRITVAFLSIVDTQHKTSVGNSVQEEFNNKIKWLTSLHNDRGSTILELLVSISGLLTPADYMKLTPIIWHRALDAPSPKVTAPVSSFHYLEHTYLTRWIRRLF